MNLLNRARRTARWSVLLLCLGTVGFMGCDDQDDGGFSIAETGSAVIAPSAFIFSRLAVGDRAEREVVVQNQGEGNLLIANLDVDLRNAPGDYSLFYAVRPINGDNPGDQLVAMDRGAVVLDQVITVPPQSALVWVLEYAPSTEDGASGSVSFESNDPNNREIELPIQGSSGGGEINVSPVTVDFGAVEAGTTAEQEVIVTNIGSAPLNLTSIGLSGSMDFSVRLGDLDLLQDALPDDPDGDGTSGLNAGASITLRVTYSPEVEGPDVGELSIQSDDGDRPDVRVSLTANGASPCIKVNPESLEFAAALQGRVTTRPIVVESCGDEPLEITAVYLSDDSSPVYAVSDESPALPIELPAADGNMRPSEQILIDFAPEDTAAYGGKLIIESNAPLNPVIEVPITGRGTLNDCPVAVVSEDTFNVLPLDIVTLDASESTDADGPGGLPVRYNWVVTQAPDGSTAEPVERFQDPRRPLDTGLPDDPSTPRALFFVDLAGTYTIELTVADNLDLTAPSETCQQPAAVVTIEAQPDQDIHVQMVWNTPSDRDQTDSEGADVDLHLRHPNGRNWAQAPLDCYYANPSPDWGPAGPPGNPSLDIDDVNGAGPENINLDEPEDTDALGGQYRVGIDYYRADNFASGGSWGPSEVTVRIYLGGVEAGEWVRVLQDTHHFWVVGSIVWTDGDRRVQEINRYYQQVP